MLPAPSGPRAHQSQVCLRPRAAAPFLLWRTPEFGYAVVTARSPTVLEIAIMDPLTGGVLDLSRIVQAPWPRGGGA